MIMDEIKHLTFDHNKPIGEMPGEAVMQEFLYLVSGCADELDPKKQVKLGLRPLLAVRKDELEKHLTACINYHRIPSVAC